MLTSLTLLVWTSLPYSLCLWFFVLSLIARPSSIYVLQAPTILPPLENQTRVQSSEAMGYKEKSLWTSVTFTEVKPGTLHLLWLQRTAWVWQKDVSQNRRFLWWDGWYGQAGKTSPLLPVGTWIPQACRWQETLNNDSLEFSVYWSEDSHMACRSGWDDFSSLSKRR